MGIFKADSPLMQKLALLFDLMVLNILTVILSIVSNCVVYAKPI